MKIIEDRLQLAATHAAVSRQTSESESSFTFRSAFASAAGTGAPSAAAPASREEAARAEAVRVRLAFQQLVAALLALLAGEKDCRCAADPAAGLPPAAGGGAAGAEVAADADADTAAAAAGRLAALPAAPRPAGEYVWQQRTRVRVEEHERTGFSACGEVRTADGRRIAFDLDLAMCRDFSATSERVESGRVVLRDPLVVNFSGKAAALAGRRVAFDLDADGIRELIPELGAGSGFLAFDRDGNRRIDDGRELFGAAGAHAGDGFADLATLDADGNGWIDAGDPAFASLAVWFADGRLESLAAAGVGALSVDRVATPFALRDAANGELGRIRASGVWLAEQGGAGTLQQVDLGTFEAGSDGDAGPGGTAGGDGSGGSGRNAQV